MHSCVSIRSWTLCEPVLPTLPLSIPAVVRLGRKPLLLLVLFLFQCHWAITAVRAEETKSGSRKEGASFELLIYQTGVTAMFSGTQPIDGEHDSDLDSNTDSIARGIDSLTFSFEGDPQEYPLPLQGKAIGSDGFFPLNVFAVDGFAAFPQATGPRWAIVELNHLRDFLQGQQPVPDQTVDDLQHYISTRHSDSELNSVAFTLKLYFSLATAIFHGRAVGTFSLSSATESLSFLLPNTNEALLFQPAGTLYPSDWRFDLASPDHMHLLLPQDHYGPYHIVSFAHLAQYLGQHKAPDYLVDWEFPGSDVDAVLSRGRWLADDVIAFSAHCCGTTATLIYRLGSDKGPVLPDTHV